MSRSKEVLFSAGQGERKTISRRNGCRSGERRRAALFTSGLFRCARAAVPIHPKDYSYYTRLVWCVDARPRELMSVGSEAAAEFSASVSVRRSLLSTGSRQRRLGCGQRSVFYNADCAVNGEGQWVWGRRFDISPEQNTYGTFRRLADARFNCRPAKLTARSSRFGPDRKFIIAGPARFTTKPRSWISEISKSSASFCSIFSTGCTAHWFLRLVDSRAHCNY